jgi:hypothetical protein
MQEIDEYRLKDFSLFLELGRYMTDDICKQTKRLGSIHGSIHDTIVGLQEELETKKNILTIEQLEQILIDFKELLKDFDSHNKGKRTIVRELLARLITEVENVIIIDYV